MMLDYLTVYAFGAIAVLFAAVSLLAAWLLRPSAEDPLKQTTYECGIPSIGTTEVKTNIRFYLYALLFVIFDVEVLFVFPWAVNVRAMGPVALLEMLIFMAVLVLGLFYAWGKGALTWE